MFNFLRNWLCGEILNFNSSLLTQVNDLKELLEIKTRTVIGLTSDLKTCETGLAKLSYKSQLEQFLDVKYPTTKLVYTKRWVLDKKNFPEPLDIRDFIKYYYSLPKFEDLSQVFTNPIRYVSDNYSYNGVMDVWQTATETYTLSAGDCDDSGVYRACLARKLGNKEVFCALGFWKNQGHLFNIMWQDGGIYIVENTSNTYNPILIESINDTKTDYKINYIFNENKTWIIDGSIIFGSKLFEDFNLMGDANAIKKQ